MAVSSRIFISYRRDDAPAYAGRLFDQLSSRFGASQVFMDVDTLEPGVDFVQRIEESVGSADVLIAVIGRSWASAVDENGNRRLDEPDDFVRLEVGGALRRDIRVIPVLVNGAKMPQAEELPEDLDGLARRNGLEIADTDWRSGTERLFVAIEHVLGTPAPATTRQPPPAIPDDRASLSSAVLPLALAGAVLLAIGPFLRWDKGGNSFLQNDFGGTLSHGGIFTALAPIGIVVAAVLGLLFARSEGTRAVGAGVLIGAGITGVVKYVRVLLAGQDPSTGVTIGVLAALVGGLLVLAAGVLVLQATTAVESPSNATAAILGMAGAAAMIVATVIPFNGGGPASSEQEVTRTFDEAFDPIVTAFAIALIAALLFGRWRHAELSAALLTMGVLAGLLWIRYLGVPLVQDSSVGSFAPGGLVGTAGAALVVLGGYLGLARSKVHPSVAATPA